jgi:DNA replication protein DnaC
MLALLQILEDRYGKKSIIITSQQRVVKWYDFIAEPTLADAIMYRLAGNAHRIELKGESLRKKKSEKKNKFTYQNHCKTGWLTLSRNGGLVCPE